MSWVQIDPIKPLSTMWTVAQAVTTVRGMLGSEYSSERIQTQEIRRYLNLSLSELSDIIRKVQPEVYSHLFTFKLEKTDLFSISGGTHKEPGSYYYRMDLSEPYLQGVADTSTYERNFQSPDGFGVGQFLPLQYIRSIDALSLRLSPPTSVPSPDHWIGSAVMVPLQKFMGIATTRNDQWRQSIIYARHGNHIMVHMGEEVEDRTASNLSFPTTATDPYKYVGSLYFDLWVNRLPLLDTYDSDRQPDTTWEALVDCPDNYMNLLLQKTKLMALQAMNKSASDPMTEQQVRQQEAQLMGGNGNGAPA